MGNYNFLSEHSGPHFSVNGQINTLGVEEQRIVDVRSLPNYCVWGVMPVTSPTTSGKSSRGSDQQSLGEVLSCDSKYIIAFQIHRGQRHGQWHQLYYQTKFHFFTALPPDSVGSVELRQVQDELTEVKGTSHLCFLDSFTINSFIENLHRI